MFSYTEESHNAFENASKRVTWVSIGLGIATLISGAWGLFGRGPVCKDSILDGLYRLGALFEFSEVNLTIGACYPYGQIEFARFTGPAATIVLVIRVLMEFLQDPFNRLRLFWFSGHTEIIGFGAKGQVRALEAASGGAKVVAIESAPGEASHTAAARHGVVLVIGDARQKGALSRAHMRRAARFIVATGDDSRNLSIAQAIAEQVSREPVENRGIEVSPNDPVIRRALDVGTEDGLIDAFVIEHIAAHRLCEVARFFAVADLLGQRRMHIVMLGFDYVGVSIAAQILRSSQITDLGATRITILSTNPDSARDLLLLSYPGIEIVAEIAHVAADPRVVAIDGPLMAEIEAAAPITAIIVLGGLSADILPTALAVREASRRTGRWMAPIFFGTEQAAYLTGFPPPVGSARRSVFRRYCIRSKSPRNSADGNMLRNATGLPRKDESYRLAFAQIQADGQKPSSASQALVPWRQLTRRYRQANRSRKMGRRRPTHLTSPSLADRSRSRLSSASTSFFNRSPRASGPQTASPHKLRHLRNGAGSRGEGTRGWRDLGKGSSFVLCSVIRDARCHRFW